MIDTEKTYIAGIVDGEGSTMLTRFHKNQYHSPCISISSTDLELLEWVKNTVGAGKINTKKNYNEKNHKNSYTYTIIYNEAIQLPEDIEPYLVILKKKERAKFIVDNYKKVTIKNGRYNEEQRKAKGKF